MSKCAYCQKDTPNRVIYCSWACHIENAKKLGGRVITPNGLPIKCINANADMLEIEHGDHPDYKFPVSLSYFGSKEDNPNRLYNEAGITLIPVSDDEYNSMCFATHALIYADDNIALTINECSYYLWTWRRDGLCSSGCENWKLTDEAIQKIAQYVEAK